MLASINKSRLPKGLSYALKSSMILGVIEETERETTLSYVIQTEPGMILSAHYWFPNKNNPHDRIYITSGAVKSTDRLMAVGLLEDRAIPEFKRWLAKILTLPSNSTERTKDFYFRAELVDGSLNMERTP